MIVETHIDPTGSLVLAVDRTDGRLISIGFEGFEWHTHPDLLMGEYGPTAEMALEAFKHALMSDELVIAIIRRGSRMVDVSLPDEPLSEHESLSEGETLERRHWSGRLWSQHAM
ncbi:MULTISPECIES: hypothetical protein [unclassified Bosea (in: a-proteobacteria)]|uniref:hypothetical protein n=1 Tax=unclassified Bosea (in: a-proteobacteria) TaxID=2653178 RepID=UPI000F7588ED|nr:MULTISPECIES: hypothetical protein [unclassified Bosea (in: a-proteobacteria)]AZO82107.1 hypothetical protein BLM15_30465 [Bosea sp. Tri-49]RXT24684.1 hypothetical protein B5U98_08590 [Bosea sp. Tri-39]RXT42519.1 hypothetical protein B5U99_01060 [Bosea sp. Tri-54]